MYEYLRKIVVYSMIFYNSIKKNKLIFSSKKKKKGKFLEKKE